MKRSGISLIVDSLMLFLAPLLAFESAYYRDICFGSSSHFKLACLPKTTQLLVTTTLRHETIGSTLVLLEPYSVQSERNSFHVKADGFRFYCKTNHLCFDGHQEQLQFAKCRPNCVG